MELFFRNGHIVFLLVKHVHNNIVFPYEEE